MQIEVRLDDSCPEPKVIVLTDRMTEEVSDILRKLFVRISSSGIIKKKGSGKCHSPFYVWFRSP